MDDREADRARRAALDRSTREARARRDRRSEQGATPGAADRVRRSHAQTRPTLRLALVAVAAAGVAAAAGAPRWVVLHLFLAGGVVLAISAVSLLLTVTWSAAPAPPDRWVQLQRFAVTGGAVGVVVGRTAGWPGLLGVGGAVHLAGLGALATLLVHTARRGVERRFDVAVAAYLAALAAGVAASTLGLVMALDVPTAALRSAHVTLHLLGLVGLVVGGTLPFFTATVVRSRMAPAASPLRLRGALAWQVAAVALSALGLAVGADVVAAAGLGSYAAGIVAVLLLVPRPTKRQLAWAGPRLVGLWAGGAWWAVAVTASAVDVLAGSPAVFAGRWLLVLVVAGYGQIVAASLAYLVPVLRGGGHERLAAGFATTRSWIGVGALNVAGVSMALAAPAPLAATAVAVALVDTAGRMWRVGLRPVPRPPTAPGAT